MAKVIQCILVYILLTILDYKCSIKLCRHISKKHPSIPIKYENRLFICINAFISLITGIIFFIYLGVI
jgi:hypothetical protein